MAITFVFGSERKGYPQGVNREGEQGILFSVSSPFDYQGHRIHGFELWTYDVGNYNQTLNEWNIL